MISQFLICRKKIERSTKEVRLDVIDGGKVPEAEGDVDISLQCDHSRKYGLHGQLFSCRKNRALITEALAMEEPEHVGDGNGFAQPNFSTGLNACLVQVPQVGSNGIDHIHDRTDCTESQNYMTFNLRSIVDKSSSWKIGEKTD